MVRTHGLGPFSVVYMYNHPEVDRICNWNMLWFIERSYSISSRMAIPIPRTAKIIVEERDISADVKFPGGLIPGMRQECKPQNTITKG